MIRTLCWFSYINNLKTELCILHGTTKFEILLLITLKKVYFGKMTLSRYFHL